MARDDDDYDDTISDGEDGEDDELNENDYKIQKDAILFAIDVSKSMLEKPPPAKTKDKKADTDSPVAVALKVAYQLMQQRIISQPKDMMGILLFGTEKTKFRGQDSSCLSYPHCYLFLNVDIPAAEDVKALRSLVEEDEGFDDILQPASDTIAMSDVLFCANQVLTTSAPNFGSRRLFVITDNDDPHRGDKQARSAAAVRSKDLYDLGISIELFPIAHADRPFDLSKFYEDIVYLDSAVDEETSTEIQTSESSDGLTLLNSLISNVNSKQTPKRSCFSDLDFEIAPGLTISVNGYILTKRQEPARTCYVWLDGETPQIAKGETVRIDDDSARTVEEGRLKKAYKFGGEYIYFAPEELTKLRSSFGRKIIRIIGFKSRRLLPAWASVNKSTFIYPSEGGFVGSTRVFSALWQKLLRDNKMAIAWSLPRANAQPSLVAILPSRPRDDPNSGTPYLPAGLWLYPLPFADDLRTVDSRDTPRCPNPIIDQMRVIIQNLQLPKAIYHPSKYPNPSLQWHYKILQALALEDEVPDQPNDATLPRYKAINKRVGGYIFNWHQAVRKAAAEFGRDTHSSSKRTAMNDDDGGQGTVRLPKRAKQEVPPPSAMSNAQLKAVADQDGLNKFTVVQLKEMLGQRGLNDSGKKTDLVDRLETWLEEQS